MKRWIRDHFDGDTFHPLAGHVADTQQEWKSSGNRWQQFQVEDGKAFWEYNNPYGYDNYARYILIEPPQIDLTAENRYEWTLNRFPVQYMGSAGFFYRPQEALLVFETPDWLTTGYKTRVNAVRVQYDRYYRELRVSTPTSSDDFSLDQGMEAPAAWYTPLPALDHEDHPDSYHFEIVTTPSGITLKLNGDTIYTNASRRTVWWGNAGSNSSGGLARFAGLGCVTGYGADLLGADGGFNPGSSIPIGFHTQRGVIEFTEMRVNFVELETSARPPLRQLHRRDEKKPGGAPHERHTQSRPLWQYGGYN